MLRKRILQNIIEEENLVIGGHCGICGRWIPDQLLPKSWSWGICDRCQKDTERSVKELEEENKSWNIINRYLDKR